MADRRSVGWSQYNGLDSGDELSSINVTAKYENKYDFIAEKGISYTNKTYWLTLDLCVGPRVQRR